MRKCRHENAIPFYCLLSSFCFLDGGVKRKVSGEVFVIIWITGLALPYTNELLLRDSGVDDVGNKLLLSISTADLRLCISEV